MKRAFTLIELLVVIAIVAVLAVVLFPVFTKAKHSAKRSACLSNLRQIAIANELYLNDYDDLMPWIPDSELQLTPPVNSGGKRYAVVGSFMPLWHPYLKNVQVFRSPVIGGTMTGWKSWFEAPWRENGADDATKGTTHYISDLLAEVNPLSPRFTRGRSPQSVCDAKGVSVSEQEWIMSPFYEANWWAFSHALWSVNGAEPPPDGWSAHVGGRNQVFFDMHAKWVRKDVKNP